MNADKDKILAVYKGIKDIPTIPELSWKSTTTYVESDANTVIFPLIDQHDAILICGSYFGDEGDFVPNVDPLHHLKSESCLIKNSMCCI